MRLPEFLIIGTAKAGTSAATKNLSLHPDVDVLPRKKDRAALELHYFRARWSLGLEWYVKHFDSTKRLVGEKSTDYFANIECHSRMRAVLPRAKLLLFLREPAARAYSHWNHFQQIYGNKRTAVWHMTSFEEAMFEPLTPWYHRELFQYGCYFDYLQRLLKLFPRSQIYIAIMERVRANMTMEYAKIFEFLDVDPSLVDPSQYVFDNAYEYVNGPMKPETREILRDKYRPQVEQLRTLLDDPLEEWK